VSEALALYPRDVDESAGTVRVREGKGRKARVAVIDAEALAHLCAWLELRRRLGINGRYPIFCSVADGSKGQGVRKAGRPLDPSYVRRLLPKLAERTGIDKRVHAHGSGTRTRPSLSRPAFRCTSSPGSLAMRARRPPMPTSRRSRRPSASPRCAPPAGRSIRARTRVPLGR
jgi:hypothetical protein